MNKNYVDENVTVLQTWLQTQNHLPEIVPALLKTFNRVCDGDLEKTQNLININYTLRFNNPQIFLNRDPCSPEAKRQLQAETTIGLPKLTPDGNKVFIYKLEDTNPELFNFTESIKIFIMFMDARAVLDEKSNGEISIFDMAGYTLKHFASSKLSVIRILLKFLQEAITLKLKEIHIINCPSYVDKIMIVVRPFMKGEIYKMIKFHQPNSESLYKFVPKEMLPNEYGGQAGQISQFKSDWIDVIEAQREYLTNPKYWMKSNGKKNCDNDDNKSQEFQQQFRKLAVD